MRSTQIPGFRVACVVFSLLAGDSNARASEATAPTVEAPAGALSGVRQGRVDAFLGIPYARAPIGDLRWRAPVPMPRWSGTRASSSFGASCYQPWPARPFGPYTIEFVDTPEHSEDCLYLNVWTTADRAAKRPVLVWVHGGGFMGGSGAVPIYNGAKLAEQNVVVVTINYRLGPFGFLAHPELTRESNGSGAGNYGLQDIIAALKWVRDNIASFGGDPANVTVAGQSAGAIAVNDLLASPQAKGLFARAIAQSGSGMGIPAIPLAQAEQNGVRFAELLEAPTLAALRALPPERIQAAIPTPFGPPPKDAPPRIELRPVLDGVVLPVDPADGAVFSKSDVPVITGFNADEFMPEHDRTREQFVADVKARFGKHASTLLALYPHSTDAEAASSARLLIRDSYMTALWLWSSKRTKSAGAPVYAYLFTHPIPVAKLPSHGTHHSSEIPYLFGVLDRKLRPFTDADDRIAAQLQTYWLNFLRTGDPNSDALPKWLPLDEQRIRVMGLGDDPGMREPASSRARFDALVAYVADGGRLGVR